MNINDKRELLFRKQRGKTYLQKYFQELNTLLNKDLGEYKILDLEETDRIINGIKDSYCFKERIIFDQRKTYLDYYFHQYLQFNQSKVYLFTNYSIDCGITILDNLNMFKTDFDFYSEHAGLISLISEDLLTKIVLDFEEQNGQYFLEIELHGECWEKVKKLN